MSDSDSDSSTGVRTESSYEDGTHVISEEIGGVATETKPVEEDEKETATEVIVAPSFATDEDRDERKGWIPLAIGVFLIVAIAALAIVLLLRTGTPGQLGEAGERGVEKQADWKFMAKTIGGKHPSGDHPVPPKKETQAIEKLVRDWNDALILSPGQFGAMTKKYFAPPAGNAMSSSNFGLPKGADKVETTRRFARISIEADGAKRAVVRVSVVSRGHSDDGEFRSESKSTLWLERTGSKWHVIAFDANQQPLPLNPKPQKKDKSGDSAKGNTPKGDSSKDNSPKGEPKNSGAKGDNQKGSGG